MVLRPFVYILFIFNSSAFAQSELGGSDLPETQSAAAQDVEGSGGQCKPAQVQRNRDIIQRCNSNWANWGIDTPPANELRNENDCESVASAETLLGCGDAVLALPIFLGELAVMGIAATIPIDRNTFGFVSQNGSLQEIQAFLTGEFFHEQCGLYPWQESTYPSEACPDRESHLDPEAHGVCRQQAVQRVQEFVECRSSGDVRALYRERRSSYDARARQIKSEQDERRALEQRRSDEISRIRSTCRSQMNPLSSSMAILISPLSYLAGEAQSRVAPTQSQVEAYTNCVEQETSDNQELREELIHAADGLVAQISRSFSSIKCYNGRIRKALMCEVALGVLSGGAALSASAARRLGREGVEEWAERMGRAEASEVLDETAPTDLISAQLRNGALSDEDRISAAARALGLENLTEQQRTSLLAAHNIGSARGAGIGSYTREERLSKARTLMRGGFSRDQAQVLLDQGIAGAMPDRALLFSRAYQSGEFSGTERFASVVFGDRRVGVEVIGRNADGSLDVLMSGPNGTLQRTTVPRDAVATMRTSSTARDWFLNRLDGEAVEVTSRSGNIYTGQFRGISTVNGEEVVEMIGTDGTVQQLRVARLDMSSLRRNVFDTPTNDPRAAAFRQAYYSGNLDDDSRYVSFLASDGNRYGVRLNAINADGSVSASRVLNDGTLRDITIPAEDLSSVRLSSNSARYFRENAGDATPNAGLSSPQLARPPPSGSILSEVSGDISSLPSHTVQTNVTAQKYLPVRYADGRVERIPVAQPGSYRNLGDISSFNAPLSGSLPQGHYTYIITDSGELVLGRVRDQLELGVKHINIANGRPVSVAGELRVGPSGAVEYNIESGSFSRTIAEQLGFNGNTMLENSASRALSRYLGDAPTVRQGTFFGELPPVDAIARCAEAAFSSLNPHICR